MPINNNLYWEVVVAQLVEWLLPILEVRSSNPVIGKIEWTLVYCELYWKDKNKEKRGREWPILKKSKGFYFDPLILGKA